MSDEEIVLVYGSELMKTSKFQKLKEFRHHGTINVLEHSVRVAKEAVRIAKRFNIKCSKRDLVLGSLLHDYFLYDWHITKNRIKLHGIRHPKIALENAKKDFKITDIEADMIEKHMWPLTIALPKYKETWIIILADKIVAISDMLRISQISFA